MLPCAVNSLSSSDRFDQPSPMFPSVVTSLSSAIFIPVTSCISSIHLLLGRPFLLLPSPYASIIFHNPSDCIICPKSPSFLLSVVCCSVSSSSLQISMRTLSLVFFSVRDILFIFLHILVSHALIFFSVFFVIVNVPQLYRTVGKISILIILFSCLCSRVCLAVTFLIHCSFSYRHPSFCFVITPSLFSTSDPRNV